MVRTAAAITSLQGLTDMRKIPIHALIFTTGPILSLYVPNAHWVLFREVLRPLVVAIVVALLLWLAFYWLTRDSKKSSLLVSIFFVLFFSYFYVTVPIVEQASRLDLQMATNSGFGAVALSTFWLVISAAIFLGGMYLIARSQRDFQLAQDCFNLMALVMAATMVFNWFADAPNVLRARSYRDSWHSVIDSGEHAGSDHDASDTLPDIYYIILDGYARSDVLEEVYQLDNSDFTAYLVEKGFFVADKSCSNYAQTALSLASSLNLMYLDNLEGWIGHEPRSPWYLSIMIDQSRVVELLKEHGYNTLSFSTGFSLTENHSADIRWVPPGSVSMFENLVIRITPISVFLELPFLKSQYDLHRERILFALDHLPDATEIDGPTFVLAHIVAPHPPFVFGSDGEQTSHEWRLASGGGFTLDDASDYTALYGRSGYVKGYRDQLTFITSRLEQSIDEILLRSSSPPIIIVQADHGPGSMLDWDHAQDSYLPERMSILNAYYLPDENYDDFYPEVSPVNTFRLVLNRLMGADYELLADRSFFSTTNRPFSFLDVTDQVSPRGAK